MEGGDIPDPNNPKQHLKDDSDPKVETIEFEEIEDKEADDVESEVEYFNRWPTNEEKEYHKDLFNSPETPYFLGNW